MGLCEVLTVIFVVMKVMGLIQWSWWVVFLPLLVELGLVVILFITWLAIRG